MKQDGLNRKDWLARLKEPSTYAALAGMAGIFGVSFSAPEVQGVAMIGGVLSGMLGIFLPERK